MTDPDLRRIAAAFLESLRANEHGGDAADDIDELAEEDPESAWGIALAAVGDARTPFELQCIGAFVVEPLLRLHPFRFADRVAGEIGRSAPFARAAAAAHMTGVPGEVWRRINDALRAAGIPERQLVDWDTIKPPPEM